MIRLSKKHPAGLNLSSMLILLFIVFLPATVIAADTPDTPTLRDLIDEEPKEGEEAKKITVTKAIPQDEFDRGTPRSSIMGFVQALENNDYERAMNYLDTRNLPSHLRSKDQELARELKIIAERSLWVDMDSISNDPKGHKGDGLPSHRDIIAQLETPDGTVDFLMQRVADSNGDLVWKISNLTVSKIPLLYEHYGYGEYGDKLSQIFPEYEILGMLVWQWVMLLGIVLAAFVISWLITRIASLILSLRKDRPYTRLHTFIARPVRFLIFAVIIRVNHDLISPTYTTNAILEAKTLEVIALTWVITGMVGLAFGRLGDRMKEKGNDQVMVMLRPAATLIKIIIILIAAISWLGNLGFNVSAMLAGLGVGGIAIGLAAQKSIENLIGGITLYTAQPINIGDFCRVGSTIGIVEEIGLRSTIIRSLDRSLITIPNANMASVDIQNMTKRDKILFNRTIRLRNDTTPDQLRTVLDGVRDMFGDHPDVDPEPARIRFTEYGEHSLNLEVFAYIKTRDFNEYLGSVEDLNLRILDIIAATGTQLALPARSVWLESEATSA